MKIICKNPRNIIIAVAFAFVCLASADTAEAACYKKKVCDVPVYGPSCPSWQPYYVSTQVVSYGSPSMVCWPIGGYSCGLGNFMVCCAASNPWAGGWGNWSYPSKAIVAYSCRDVEVCNGECDNSILNACTTPNSLIASFGQTDDANYWYWYCPGKGPGGLNSPQCSLHKPVPGACQTFSSGIDPLPTASNQLCVNGGTASPVLGNGTNSSEWSWTCSGQYGGSPSGTCTAKKPCVYDNYSCSRSPFDVKCENTYPENCGKSLPVSMICSARDVNGTCSGVPSQSNCVNAGVPCSNSTETCASCPLEPGIWREVTP